MADQDLSKMKVAELRDALKARGLNTTGNKQELVDRLQSAMDGSNPDLDSKLEDELLNDDFEDEDEKSLLDSTHDLLKSPDSSKSSTPEQNPPKKVSLKRNLSIITPTIIESSKSEEEVSSLTTSSTFEPDKKVVKLSEMSAQERLELRGKKFGGSASAAVVSSTTGTPIAASKEKLDARAARFGVISSTSTTAATPIAAPSTEVLKKRAERFGAISTDVKKLEIDEKLQKRKERFGMEGKVALSSTATADYEEKARLRAERFKTAA